jgi:alpha-mannosidase/mannosylglycerate hydrolase
MSNRQAKYAFRIYGPDGQELAYQRLGQQSQRNRWRILATHFSQGYAVNVARVSLPLRIVALGYITLTIKPGEPGLPARHPALPGLVCGERSMENEALRVEVEADGTLSVTDKHSGETYTRLMTFEDCADIGDGWNHGAAISDAAFFSNGCHTSISLTAQGRYKASFRIRTQLDVPAEFDFSEMLRSTEIVQVVVDSTVTLRAGADRLEVETVVHNCAKDHRLRVLFPSGADARTYLADTPFDVVERPIALRADNHIYREMEIEAKPQQSFSAVFDGQRGLAVASTGLLESGVIDLPARPLALTLFRATGQTVGTSGEPDGQMQGELRFNYWIVPFSGAPRLAHIARLGQLLAGGFRAVQQRKEDVRMHRQATALPAQAGFMRLEGAVVLTSLRRTAAGLEARVYNPNQADVEAVFDFSACPSSQAQPTTAQPVNLESRPVGAVQNLEAGRAAFNLRPKQILTVCFA